MSRLIDAEALITILDEELQKDSSLSKVLLVGFAKQILNDAPTIDAEPVRHAHWEYIGGYGYQYRCSNPKCIKCVERKTRYCPNCGAKMDEVTE